MARQRLKSDLPTKICPVCDRPFTWRKNGLNVGTMLNIVPTDAEEGDRLLIIQKNS